MVDQDSNLQVEPVFTKFFKNAARAYVLLDGIIEAVNGDFTCDVQIQGVTYSSVPVSVLIDSQANWFQLPLANSACLIMFRDGSRSLPQIIFIDKLDTAYLQPQNNLFLSAKKTQFNDGSNGGIPLSQDVTDRLNLIEDNVNEILDILKSIVVPTTVPYPFAPLFASVNDLTPTQPSDIENPDITQ